MRGNERRPAERRVRLRYKRRSADRRRYGLRGFATGEAAALVSFVQQVAAVAPFRRMVTPGGFQMSVAMTNCGRAGWITDRRGYRYVPCDPTTDQPWPAMPAAFDRLAARAAAAAGFSGFAPDSCLINRYEPG